MACQGAWRRLQLPQAATPPRSTGALADVTTDIAFKEHMWRLSNTASAGYIGGPDTWPSCRNMQGDMSSCLVTVAERGCCMLPRLHSSSGTLAYRAHGQTMRCTHDGQAVEAEAQHAQRQVLGSAAVPAAHRAVSAQAACKACLSHGAQETRAGAHVLRRLKLRFSTPSAGQVSGHSSCEMLLRDALSTTRPGMPVTSAGRLIHPFLRTSSTYSACSETSY
jgi:hypothetical protein